MKPERSVQAGVCVNHASATPRTTSAPAQIRTCRSSDIALRPRRSRRPAVSQAAVPPSTLATAVSPAARSFSHACRLRPPDLQTTYSVPGRPARSAAIALGSSRSRGTFRAPSTWASPYSAGVRTSRRSNDSPRRRVSARTAGVIVSTILWPPEGRAGWVVGGRIVPPPSYRTDMPPVCGKVVGRRGWSPEPGIDPGCGVEMGDMRCRG